MYFTDVIGRPLNPPLQIRFRKKNGQKKILRNCLNVVKFYQISWVVIIRGGNWVDENFSRWEFPGWDLAGWELSGWEFSWVGVVRVEIFRLGVFLGGSCPGRNIPDRSFLGWELSRWDLSWLGIFFGGGFPGGNCPVGIIRVAVFLVQKTLFIMVLLTFCFTCS